MKFGICLVFAFDTPSGGWKDLLASFDDIDEAKSEAKACKYKNWQVVNTETGELIEGFNKVKT